MDSSLGGGFSTDPDLPFFAQDRKLSQGSWAAGGSVRFRSDLTHGILIKRYKRFLADVRLDSGEEVTAHCPNTGAMRGLTTSGTRVYLSCTPSLTRKYPYTWEMIQEENGGLIGVNTANPNAIVAQALEERSIPELEPYDTIRREVSYGHRSRIDFLLEKPGEPPCYVEVKNVHYCEGDVALFPDSPTVRGQKHMDELGQIVRQGAGRSVIIYVVQREDCEAFGLGDAFDPVYAERARQAFKDGVEPLAYGCKLTLSGITLQKRLDFPYTVRI